METTTVTVQIPQIEAMFLKQYTQRHNTTISQLFDYFIEQLQLTEYYRLHEEIEKHTGIIPSWVDAKKEYYDYLEAKHR